MIVTTCSRRFTIFLTALCLMIVISPLHSIATTRLKVTDNRRYLQYEDGKPFFYLGDTAWELFHKLNREEATLMDH